MSHWPQRYEDVWQSLGWAQCFHLYQIVSFDLCIFVFYIYFDFLTPWRAQIAARPHPSGCLAQLQRLKKFQSRCRKRNPSSWKNMKNRRPTTRRRDWSRDTSRGYCARIPTVALQKSLWITMIEYCKIEHVTACAQELAPPCGMGMALAKDH